MSRTQDVRGGEEGEKEEMEGIKIDASCVSGASWFGLPSNRRSLLASLVTHYTPS